MNAADVIFGVAYGSPRSDPQEKDEVEWTLECDLDLYIELLEAKRERTLIRMGLDPHEYSFENDELSWRSFGFTGQKMTLQQLELF